MAAAALEQLAAHRGTVRGVLLRLVKDEALAEDLVQEAFIRATRAIGAWRGEAASATWLTAIALNVARDHFRARTRRPPADPLDRAEDIPDPYRSDAAILQAEMSACILGHVARLSERQREAVLMHHFGGLGYQAIATALAVSEGNARVILHRGLAALRASLSRECVLDFNDEVPCEQR